MGRKIFLSALAFLLAAVVIYPLAVIGGVLIGEALGVSQMEGAYAMFIGSTIAPLIAAGAGVIAAIFTARRVSSKGNPSSRTAAATSRLIAVVGGGVAGYAFGWAGRWLMFDGQSFETYGQAALISLMPLLGMLAGVLIGILVSRNAKPDAS